MLYKFLWNKCIFKIFPLRTKDTAVCMRKQKGNLPERIEELCIGSKLAAKTLRWHNQHVREGLRIESDQQDLQKLQLQLTITEK